MTSVYKPFKAKAEFGQVSGELQVIRRALDKRKNQLLRY